MRHQIWSPHPALTLTHMAPGGRRVQWDTQDGHALARKLGRPTSENGGASTRIGVQQAW